jgi:hypothetical protein
MIKTMLFATALLIGGVSIAQEKDAKSAEMSQEKKSTPEERATRLTKRMTEKLKLSTDQSSRIGDINSGIAQKNQGIRDNTTMAKEEKMKLIKSNHDARVAMYRDVLTAEQMTQYEAWEKEKMEKHTEHKAEVKGKGKGKGKGKKPETEKKETENESEEL